MLVQRLERWRAKNAQVQVVHSSSNDTVYIILFIYWYMDLTII